MTLDVGLHTVTSTNTLPPGGGNDAERLTRHRDTTDQRGPG